MKEKGAMQTKTSQQSKIERKAVIWKNDSKTRTRCYSSISFKKYSHYLHTKEQKKEKKEKRRRDKSPVICPVNIRYSIDVIYPSETTGNKIISRDLPFFFSSSENYQPFFFPCFNIRMREKHIFLYYFISLQRFHI